MKTAYALLLIDTAKSPPTIHSAIYSERPAINWEPPVGSAHLKVVQLAEATGPTYMTACQGVYLTVRDVPNLSWLSNLLDVPQKSADVLGKGRCSSC